ncbi:MAG: 30S ribosomal protein S8 [Methanofollis sp.]|uniref:30S ribosomal protein S8 n=1 Tax=Methanofollis sp. TaxID=2052835 RepID=UPI002638BC2F|nr:30S ribosomal protein S8 [Methanofollis sp.]MDD4254763.1 30S ribosomal protein S8 [Methanofollis sp.]
MARLNSIADTMSAIKNASDGGKSSVIVEPASKLVGAMLGIMQESGYIGEFEYVEDGRGGQFRIGLVGRINKCGAVTPRFSTALEEMEKWENRYLPAKGFGILIMSTSSGVMSHEQARRAGIGGELLGFVY